jgi:L-threonylcarbamoyladenylate synthase
VRAPIVPIEEGLPHAAAVLKRGGVVAFPTETSYGLGASISNLNGIKKIYAIKGREWKEPLIVLIDHSSTLPLVARNIPEKVQTLLQTGWPSAFTIILDGQPHLHRPFLKDGSVAVRLTTNPWARNLIRITGQPISGTSANRTGEPPALCAYDASKLDVDLVLDGGETRKLLPSTLAKPTEQGWDILRQGSHDPFLPPVEFSAFSKTWMKTTIPTTDAWTYQPEKGYRFSIDSILLSSFTRFLAPPMDRALDMGSGSGVLSFIMAKRSKIKRIDAIEVMEEFHSAFERAVKEQSLSHKIDPILGNLINSKRFLPGNSYDLAIVNPPYYKSGAGKTSPSKSKATANSEHIAPLSLFLEEAKRVLKQGAILSIIIPENRLQETLSNAQSLCLNLGYMQPVYPHKNKNANRLLLAFIKNRNPPLKILQPLFIFDSNNNYTVEMENLLKTVT